MKKKLRDFECPYSEVDAFVCSEDCPLGCESRDVYRKYLKLQRCARLLRVFVNRWHFGGRLIIQGDGHNAVDVAWRRFGTFIDAIRSALREAGL